MANILDKIKNVLDLDSYDGMLGVTNCAHPVAIVFGRTGDDTTGETRVISLTYEGTDYEITAKKISK